MYIFITKGEIGVRLCLFAYLIIDFVLLISSYGEENEDSEIKDIKTDLNKK